MDKIVLRSTQDQSVNFVTPVENGDGFLEARYVRRGNYFVAYISSQTACNRGCRFCHLTTTKQTVGRNASKKEIVDQARTVLSYYADLRQRGDYVDFMHFNFMARGEPLCNPNVGDDVLTTLGWLAENMGIPSKVNISTIMPRSLDKPLYRRFMFSRPTIYYSLYSVREGFRKKWIPNAMPFGEALSQLSEYNHRTGGAVKIHFAFIEGENDSPEDMAAIVDEVKARRIPGLSFNIVRYNPPNDLSRESSADTIERNVTILRKHFPVQVVSRVGYDVYASCGMFVQSGVGIP